MVRNVRRGCQAVQFIGGRVVNMGQVGRFFDGDVSRYAFRLVPRFLPVRNQVGNRKQGRHWAGGFVRRGGLRVAL